MKKISIGDLARVGPRTPAGEWFRRYWLVVATAGDLRDIPLGLKILGEELVLFRDLKGNMGLLGFTVRTAAARLNTATSRRAASAAPGPSRGAGTTRRLRKISCWTTPWRASLGSKPSSTNSEQRTQGSGKSKPQDLIEPRFLRELKALGFIN